MNVVQDLFKRCALPEIQCKAMGRVSEVTQELPYAIFSKWESLTQIIFPKLGNKHNICIVRISSRGTLRDFWKKHPDSEQQLKAWHQTFQKTEFKYPNEIKSLFGSADIINDGKVIFNICGIHYRLIAKFNYSKHLVFVLFLGTHKEYDRIDVKKL